MQMIPIRIFFSKTGRVKYTSHLDTMRAMTRAFSRSGLPFWKTQGFNPHMYMTFALPIALGYEGLCESIDARLTEETPFEEVVKRLQDVVPPGFEILEAATPVREPSAIALADYMVHLRYREPKAPELCAKLDAFLQQPVIEVTKKTKKGNALVDIKPLCALLEAQQAEQELRLRLRLATGNTVNINPTLFLKAFYDWCGILPEGANIVRTGIYTAEMEIFR